MIECTVELCEDFSNNLTQIANLLHSKALISSSVKEEALNQFIMPLDRATKLVSVITNRMQIQPEAFNTFVGILDPVSFQISLGALATQYKENSESMQSIFL